MPNSSVEHPQLKPLVLKAREERRLRAGHLWVFSNEVDTKKSPLQEFEPGEFAALHSASGRPLGTVYVNPQTLICARVVSRSASRVLDKDLLRARLTSAMALRQRLFSRPFFRCVYGEADYLPGLIIDRYDRLAVVQIGTAGIERLRGLLSEWLLDQPGIESVLFRNDTSSRQLEGLPSYVEWAGKEVDLLQVEEGAMRYELPAAQGQKTGWYYDQRVNRQRVASYCTDARVLDTFSYVGGFGMQAALAGAAGVCLVDASESALELALEAAQRNGVRSRISTHCGNAFDILRALHREGQRFDVVVVDPPAFAPRKRDLRNAKEAYTRINRFALRLLASDGIIACGSCSSHMTVEMLQDCLRNAARAAGKRLQIIERGQQGPDHPVHPAIAETDYLKMLIARAID